MNSTSTEHPRIQNIRRLIWLYFWLLVLEGALRKWVVPALSNPLLIVRDPVVLAIYILAIRSRVFPRNGWVAILAVIAFLSFALSFIPLWPYLPPARIALVTGYGFRANFLHLPLIWVIPRVFRPEDVKKFGWYALLVLVPMALLMVGQFRSAPDAFLNRTAGGEGEMMTAALGKVRTAATFSFVIGVVAYFAMATAYLIWAALRRDVYKSWVLFATGGALAIGIVVSGSRSVVGACGVVVASLIVVLVLRPAAVNRLGQTLIAVAVAIFVVMQTPIFKEGFNVISTRFNEVAEAEEKSIGAGMVERVLGDFTESFFVLTKAPWLGYGLGIGTNAGAQFLTGRQMFLLSEGEWPRLFLESGPLLGLAFVLWRCALVIQVGLLCLRSVKLGNVLPLLLFSSTFLPLLSGQFGQPTILGFVVLVTGLTLAARNEETATDSLAIPRAMPERTPRMARRSEYASRLHGPAVPHEESNGANGR